jgi:hypothetical protein
MRTVTTTRYIFETYLLDLSLDAPVYEYFVGIAKKYRMDADSWLDLNTMKARSCCVRYLVFSQEFALRCTLDEFIGLNALTKSLYNINASEYLTYWATPNGNV